MKKKKHKKELIEYWWMISRAWNNQYYNIKGLFSPWNRIKVRNTPRTYVDKDHLLFHGMFSVLCDFVEREFGTKGSPKGFYEYVDWCNETHKKDLMKPEGHYGDLPDGQWKSANVFKMLYDWYITTNWDDPVPYSKEYEEYLDTMVIDLNNNCKVSFNESLNPDKKLTQHRISDEKKFKKLIFKNMCLLCKYHQHMWT